MRVSPLHGAPGGNPLSYVQGRFASSGCPPLHLSDADAYDVIGRRRLPPQAVEEGSVERAGATPTSAPPSGPALTPEGVAPARCGVLVTAHAYDRESDITCGIRPKIMAVRYHLEPWPSPKPTPARS